MEEIIRLVLGIDLCYDITQVSVMRPSAAWPEPLFFDREKRMEFFPTSLYSGTTGAFEIAEYRSGEEYHRFLSEAFSDSDSSEGASARVLLKEYLRLLIQNARDSYSAEIGLVAVTCEEEKTGWKSVVYAVLQELGYGKDNVKLLSHMEAFFHFAMRQEEALWRDGSAAFDYTTDGLLYYSMECRSSGGRRILVADRKDYTNEMTGKPEKDNEKGKLAKRFAELAEGILRQNGYPLYITGRSFEGEWVSDVLHLLSLGRRVFRGQNLYTLGACFAATERFRNERNTDYELIYPDQIAVDVYLTAETIDGEHEICLARASQRFEEAIAVKELILDRTDRLTFRIVLIGGGSITVKMTPSDLQPRVDHTGRYQLRLFFTEKECMVLQLKDIGFGDIYPSSFRIYEELIDLYELKK